MDVAGLLIENDDRPTVDECAARRLVLVHVAEQLGAVVDEV